MKAMDRKSYNFTNKPGTVRFHSTRTLGDSRGNLQSSHLSYRRIGVLVTPYVDYTGLAPVAVFCPSWVGWSCVD